MGVLYGSCNLLDSLKAYKVRPAPMDPPDKFETGTGNFEGMCGVLGALEYIEWVGETYGAEHSERYAADYSGRRLSFKQGMAAIRSYEFELSQTLLDILAETPGVTIYGIKDTRCLEERVPTCAFTLAGKPPRQVAEKLDEANIFVWDGNYYALGVTERLGLEDRGGMVRVGPVSQDRWFTTRWRRSRSLGRNWRRCLQKYSRAIIAIMAGQSFLGGLGGLIHFGIIINDDPYHDGSNFFTLDI